MNQVSFTNTDEIGTPNKPLDSFKQGGEIKHISGKAGGYLVGKRHSEGGIKAINKSTGQPLEMEGGEVVITRNAVSDTQKYEFEGQMLTNREILSKINEGGGGVAFADGGEVCHVCDAEYNYKGKKMKDSEIFREMALGGEVDDILDAVDDLSFEDMDSKFDDERDAITEALKDITNWNKLCFKGRKNSPYENQYFTIGGGQPNNLYFYEVFVENTFGFYVSPDDIANMFTLLPKNFEVYVNNSEHIAYKQIGKFDAFTLGTPTGLRATFQNVQGLLNVDAFDCLVVDSSNLDLLETDSFKNVSDETLDIIQYQKSLLPEKFMELPEYQVNFTGAKFFRVFAVIHRNSPNSPVEIQYFMLYSDVISKNIYTKIYQFQISESGKIYKLNWNQPFTDFYQKSVNSFYNTYNLDIVIGYRDVYENIDLSYLFRSKLPLSIKNSELEYSDEPYTMNFLSAQDNSFAFILKGKSWDTPDITVAFDDFENEQVKSLKLDFKTQSTEKDRKYLEGRIKELGLKINLFRASMTLEEYGAVQRQLRKYTEMLQDFYLKEKNANPMTFFDQLKSALKLDFGNINQVYSATDKLSINGLPTKLTEEEWYAVRREDFKIWFGDWETAYYDQNYSGVSVIIDDATKEPMPVYHGTNVKFVDWKTYESNNLHYFAKKREMSEWFAKAWKMGRDDKAGKESAQIKQGNPFQGEYLYRVFLNIKNPIDFSPFGVEKVRLADLIAYLKIKYGVGDYDLWSNNDYFKKGTVTMESKVFTWQIIRLWQNFNTYVREFTPYDGFIFYEYIPSKANSGNIEDASLSFCAFRTEQIKFHDAVAFSPKVDDSRFEAGGLVNNKRKRRNRK